MSERITGWAKRLMKLFRPVAVPAAILGVASAALAAQPANVGERVTSHLAPHPRLLLPPGGAAALRAAAATDARLSGLWDRLLVDADAVLRQPALERKLDGKRLLAVSRDALHRVATLSLAYRATGQARFLQGARKNLADVLSFADYNPGHFLDVAEMTAALAIGYDWLYDALPDAERDAVRRAIVDKGLSASLVTPEPWWVRSGNNWNQVCHGGLVLGALAIADREPQLSTRTVARAVDALPVAMKHYAPDGAYPEGASYWEYGTTYNLLAIAALASSFGTDFGLVDQPGLLATADYHLHLVGPTGLNFSYSDGTETASKYPAAAAFFLASRRHDPSLLSNEIPAIDRLLAARPPDGRGGPDAWLWLLLLWANGNTNVPPPAATHYAARGEMPVATHRSGWDAAATFVAVKGGSPSASHGHMDVGSFCLDADGVRWIGDLGVEEYGGLEAAGIDLWNFKPDSTRWKVFRINNASHNVLTINGHPQRVTGHAAIVRSDGKQTVIDTRDVYADDLTSAARGVRLRPDRSVRVQDDVAAPPGRPAAVRWAVLTHADVHIHGSTATLTQDGRTLDVVAASPAGLTFKAVPAVGPNAFDSTNPGAVLLTLDVPLADGASASIAVDFIPGKTPADDTAESVVPLKAW